MTMNTKASHQTRAVRKALGEHAKLVKVSTMQGFRDTSVRAKELELVTHARALLVAAGFNCGEVIAYRALGPTFYIEHQ